jgi:hypothetical protein
VHFALLEEQDRLQRILETNEVEVVFLHRGHIGPGFEALRTWTRNSSIPLWYDLDDNIIEPEAIDEAAHLAPLGPTARAGIKRWVEGNRRCLQACDGALLSCPALTAAARPAQLRSRTAANHLPGFYLASGKLPRRSHDFFYIFYGPGSTDHSVHLHLVAGALSAVLARHTDVRFVLGGGMPVPEALAPAAGQIVRLPRLPPTAYYRNLAGFDVVLAPLRSDRFSACKSWIKCLEAAAQGCVWLGSPCPNYVDFHRETNTGRIVADDEWEQVLEEVISASASWVTHAQREAAKVSARYSADARIGEYLALLQSG